MYARNVITRIKTLPSPYRAYYRAPALLLTKARLLYPGMSRPYPNCHRGRGASRILHSHGRNRVLASSIACHSTHRVNRPSKTLRGLLRHNLCHPFHHHDHNLRQHSDQAHSQDRIRRFDWLPRARRKRSGFLDRSCP